VLALASDLSSNDDLFDEIPADILAADLLSNESLFEDVPADILAADFPGINRNPIDDLFY
jgi:hypothetical protein